MPALDIKSDYLESLLWKIRAVQGGEGVVTPSPGSNASDDEAGVALEARPEHLTDDEVSKEMDGLNARQQAELVALFWFGRDLAEPEEWEDTVERAAREVGTPVSGYLMGQPLLAEQITEGLSRIDEREHSSMQQRPQAKD